MQCTIKADMFLQALKQTKAALDASSHHSTAPYVILRARDGQVQLIAYTRDMRIAVDLTEGTHLEEEGEIALLHQLAQKAVESFVQASQESVSVRFAESGEKGKAVALFASADEKTQHKIQVHLQHLKFVPDFPVPYAEGATYTSKWRDYVKCEACQTSHSEERSETYQVVKTEQKQVRLSRATFYELMQRVYWVAKDYVPGGSAYSGVCLEVGHNRVTLLAAESYCAAICSQQVEGANRWEDPVLVPAKRLEQALKCLPKQSDILVVATFASYQLIQQNGQEVCDAPLVPRASEVRLLAEHIEITLLPIHEKLPPYRSAIPKQAGPTKLVMKRADVLAAFLAVAPSADFTGNPVWLHSGPKTLLEVPQNPESALREVPVLQREGPDISIPLNFRTLIAPLKAMHASPEVVIELIDSEKPMMLRSCDGENEATYMIMPTAG